MVVIELPDGSSREYEPPVSPADVAKDISAGLAKAAVAAEVDGELRDLSLELTEGTHRLKIVTERDPAALEVLRHTAAHVMAQAVRRIYGQQVQYTIGPALMDDFQYGFYYDFELPQPVGSEDLPAIEQEMQRIAGEDIPISRDELPVEAARKKFADLGQTYKVEMIDDLARQEGAQTVSIYTQGDFLDLCRGPHLPGTRAVKAFKLINVAGAYWRGDENNPMLTRIYGVAYFRQKDLDEHLERVEQARQRDHRVLGRQLELFLTNEQVGPGLLMWMPRGTIIRMQLQNWLQDELVKRGYQMVVTPHIGRLDLYRASGHYPYYKDSQFPPIELGDDDGYLLKPMNCPHHIHIFKATQHSYRDLPVRLAEFGTVYRWELSGELNGMIRSRGYTCDDAHIFCTPDQVEQEIESCVDLVKLALGMLGLNDYRVRFSLRGPESDKYVGDPKNWDRAQANIRRVLVKLEMNFTEEPGEAAFYGPKIDFIVKDCFGWEWQLGTIQVDYNLPERFGLEYAGADNAAHRPVMIHRAPFGALGRFIGILIEHFGGAFPLWLAPVQVAVLPVSDKFNDYGREVVSAAAAAGLRAELDPSADKVGAKIRRWTMQKVPYMFVVGGREAEARTVSVRCRRGGDLGAVALDEAIGKLAEQRDSRALEPVFSPRE